EAEGAPEVLFNQIASGLILENGSIIVADRGSSQVRWFASDGTFVRTSGRAGKGPGEYEFIRAAGRCVQDGFTVFDIDWTMNDYSVEGELVSTNDILLADHNSPYNLACREDGAKA